MSGSRKFCKRGSNFGVFLVDEGREDKRAIIGPPVKRQIWRADDGPTSNTGLVAW